MDIRVEKSGTLLPSGLFHSFRCIYTDGTYIVELFVRETAIRDLGYNTFDQCGTGEGPTPQDAFFNAVRDVGISEFDIAQLRTSELVFLEEV